MIFDNARTILRDAAFKIGAELFTNEALQVIGKIHVEAGIEGAEEELDIAKFTARLFSPESYYDDKCKEFWGIIKAIQVLTDYQKNKGE